MRRKTIKQIKRQNSREQRPEKRADDQAVYRMIGLATRAGRTIGGTDAVDKAIRQHQASLIIIAQDAAQRTNRQIRETAGRERILVSEFGDKGQLGHWTGSANRAVLAIMDTHFADRLNMMIGQTLKVPSSIQPAQQTQDLARLPTHMD